MLNRFFATNYTLESHRNNLYRLIREMEESDLEASDEKDQKNAENQLNFAKIMLAHINQMLALSGFDFSAKKELGKKMSALPEQFFNDEEIPLVEGPKSRVFAEKIANHYRSFTKVQFSRIEVEASRVAANFMDVRSIPDQIKHHEKLAERIEENVKAYEIDILTGLKAGDSYRA